MTPRSARQKGLTATLQKRYQVLQFHSSVSYSLPLECCVPQGRSTECLDDTILFVSFSLHYTHRIVQEMNKDLLRCATGTSEIGYY